MPSRYSDHKYSDRKGYVGPNEIGAVRRDFVSRRLNRIAWRHDLQYMRTKDPYTTYNRADRKFINKIEKYLKKTPYADDWLIARSAQRVFEAERGLLPWNEDHQKGANNLPKKLINQPFPDSLRPPMSYKRPRWGDSFKSVKALSFPYGRRFAPKGQANLRHLKNCVEYKFLDKQSSSSAISSTAPLIDCVSAGIAQGNTNSTRQGNKIFISRIQIQGRVHHSTGSGFAHSRIIVFIDREGYQGGASPTIAQLLATTGTDNFNAFRNLDHAGRFKVLADRKFSLPLLSADTDPGYGTSTGVYNFRKSFSFKNGLIQQYTGTGGAESDITKNAIYVMVVTAHGTANAVTATLQTRIRFTD